MSSTEGKPIMLSELVEEWTHSVRGGASFAEVRPKSQAEPCQRCHERLDITERENITQLEKTLNKQRKEYKKQVKKKKTENA